MEVQAEGQCGGDRGGCTRGYKGDEGKVEAGPFGHQDGIYTSLHTSTWMRVEVQEEGRWRRDRGGCTRGDKGDEGHEAGGGSIRPSQWNLHLTPHLHLDEGGSARIRAMQGG